MALAQLHMSHQAPVFDAAIHMVLIDVNVWLELVEKAHPEVATLS